MAPLRLNHDHAAILDVLYDRARVPADGLTLSEVRFELQRRDEQPPIGRNRVRVLLTELVVLGHASRRRRRDSPLRYWWVDSGVTR